MNNFEIKEIKLDKLLINPDNFRYEPVENQEEALKVMINEQGEKLVNLIKDIIKNGLNPAELVTVLEVNNLYLTLEGNRRVTALKILNNPEIIKDINNEQWKRVNKSLKNGENPMITNIMCVVYKNEEDSYKWIKLKHTGENKGKGTVGWDSQSERRYLEKISGIKPKILKIIDYIDGSDEFNVDQKNKLKKIQITNLERLLGDPDVRKVIGIDIKKGDISKAYPEHEINKSFKKIIKDLSEKDFSVKDIYTKKDRAKYIDTFKSEDLPNPEKKLSKEEHLTDNRIIIDNGDSQEETKKDITDDKAKGEEDKDSKINFQNKDNINSKKNKNIRDKKFSYNRKFLIPTDCIIKINNKRINDIYKELKSIEVDTFTNAVAVLFRVFIELSLDEYIIKYPGNDVNIDSKLNKKLEYCLNSLKSKHLLNANAAKPVNTAISSPSSIFSINTFNGYVHNKDFYPDVKELKISWNNLEKFISTIWETMN